MKKKHKRGPFYETPCTFLLRMTLCWLFSACQQPSITTSELLRQRSKLRPLPCPQHAVHDGHDDDDDVTTRSLSAYGHQSTADEHVRLLRDALERIKKSAATTDSDSDNNDDDDYDEDDNDFMDWHFKWLTGIVVHGKPISELQSITCHMSE